MQPRHQDLEKMLFANLDKYFGVKRQTDNDFNEIQKSAKAARTDSLDGIVAKCTKLCDVWLSVWNKTIPCIDKIKIHPEGLTRVTPLSEYSTNLRNIYCGI